MVRNRWRAFAVAVPLALVLALCPATPACADDPPPPKEAEECDTTPFDNFLEILRTFIGDDAGAKMEGDGAR